MAKKIHIKHILILVPIIFLLFSYINNFNGTKNNIYLPAINADEHQYLAMSVNFFKYKTISHDDPRKIPTPSNYREPLYPIYLSLFFNLLDWKNFDYSNCVYEKNYTNCLKFHQVIITANFIIFFSIIFQILFFLRQNPVIASLCSIIAIFIVPSNTISNITPELLSASLLISFSFLFTDYIYRKKFSFLWLVSVSTIFTALILIKNIFYYFLLILILISILTYIYKFIYIIYIKNVKFYLNINFNNKLILLCFFTIIFIFPYQLRNHFYFDDSSLSKRGPEVLTLRNQFVDFSYEEIFEGFKYYSPNVFGLKDDYINSKNSEKYFKFYEQNENSYWRGYNRNYGIVISYINKKYNTNYNSVEFIEPDILMEESIEIYINNIFKQSLVSVLMFYKGINNHYSYTDKNYLKNLINDIVWYFTIFMYLYLFIYNLVKGNYKLMLLGLPTFSYLFFMSTLTHYEPRFNFTIIYFCLIYILYLYEKKKFKNQSLSFS